MSFTVYKSSAGSGKTYTLVKEYLSLVLVNPYQFKSILAITFTNKAAAEMKQRVLQTLKMLANFAQLSLEEKQKNQHLLTELAEKTGLTESRIQQQAAICLTLILHAFSNFAVGTIDSFVHRIVRTFAHDLQLPLNFNVEMDGETLISQAVDILIDNMGNDELLTSFLFDFARSKADNDKSWHIENELKKFAMILLQEDSQQKIEKLKSLNLADFNKLLFQLLQINKAFEEKLINAGNLIWQKILQNKIPHEAFYYGDKGFGKYAEKLSQGIIGKPNNFVNKTVNDNKWTSGKATIEHQAAIDNIKADLTAGFYQIIHLLETEYKNYIVRNALLKNMYSLALLNEIEKIMQEMRVNDNLLHISEFNKRISEIVVNEPIPFIYERLGERYKHFLLDEFQDTSILQWQNLLPLLDNSLAENNFNMIVGDGKQAIYRFRGGEVEQFAHLPRVYKKPENSIITERENTLIRNYEPAYLKKNFRSKVEIVDFNNQFFSFAATKLNPELGIIYDKLEQEFNPENNGGLIQFDFINADEKKRYESLTFDCIINTINNLVADSYQWSDITILCRNNKQASKVAAFLTDHHIEVISGESLLLKNSPQVRLMIAFFNLLANTNHLIAKTQVVQYLISCSIIPAKDFQHIIKNSIQTDNAQNQKFDLLLRQYGIDFHTAALIKLPLYELCETLIRIFKFNQNSNPYLQFFLDCILNFSIKKTANIPNFLLWWEEQKTKLSLKTPSGSNAVTIMTVHKSKGLEFKVMIFPFADEKQRNTKDMLWIDVKEESIPDLSIALIGLNKELEETEYAAELLEEKEKSKLDLINLLYVALTRPSERLYICTAMPTGNSEQLTLSQLFKEYLQLKQLWQEGKTVYNIGIGKVQQSKTTAKDENMLQMKDFYSFDWQQRIRVSRLAPENWLAEDPDGSRRFGNIIHLILSTLKNAGEIDKTCELLQIKGMLNLQEKTDISRLLHKLWQQNDIKALFENTYPAKNEAEILMSDGSTIRPDRLLFKENECIIIDYKTGKAEDSHRRQLDHYQSAMAEMGYNNIKKCLIYVNELPELVIW